MADRSYLFWPFLDPGHLELHDRVERWAAANNKALNATNASAVRHLAEEMGKAGFFAAGSGGRNGLLHTPMDTRSRCICREVLARHANVADFLFALQGLGTAPISLFGTERQQARWLPSAAQGKDILAFALAEAENDCDVSALSTRARRDGDHWRLDGVKSWIANAEIADIYVVFARTDETPPARGLSAFVVAADAPGLSVTGTIGNFIAEPAGTIVLEDVRVPSANMIGAPGEGFHIARAALDLFRSSAGAAALGLARRALDEAIGLAGTHQLSDRSSFDFRLTHAKLADMALAIDAAALLIYRAAWTADVRGARIGREFSMARRFAIEKANVVIDSALEMCGGPGASHGRTAERLYREMGALRIHDRVAEIQEATIARPFPTGREAESCGSLTFADLSVVNATSFRPHW